MYAGLTASLTTLPGLAWAATMSHDLVLSHTGSVTIDGQPNLHVQAGISVDNLTWVAVDKPRAVIEMLTLTLHLPTPIDPASPPTFKLLSIKGVTTSTATIQDPVTVVYQATDVQPTATVSLLADFPKGYLQLPLTAQTAVDIQKLNRFWVVSSLALPGLGLLLLLWMLAARMIDHRQAQQASTQTTPPTKLAPALISILYDDMIEPEAMAATLVDLAQRGFLSLYSKDANFIVAKEREVDLSTSSFQLGDHTVHLSDQELTITEREGLKPFEKILISKLFVAARPISSKADVKIRIGHGLFSNKVAAIYEYLFAEASQVGFFVPHAGKVHQRYLLVGWLSFLIGALGFIAGAIALPDPKVFLLFWVALLAMSYLIVRLAPLVPLRTTQGRRELGQYLAYRSYLADKNPIPPGVSIDEFFAQLPLAWALRVHHEWAARFRSVIFQRPNWYFTKKTLATSVDFIEDIDHLVSFIAESFSTVREKSLA